MKTQIRIFCIAFLLATFFSSFAQTKSELVQTALDYYNKGNYKDAIVYCQKAIQLDNRYEWAYNVMGLAYHYSKNYDEAIANYKKAVLYYPTYAVAYYNLGLAYYDSGNYNESIVNYKQALLIDAKHPNANYNMALAYYSLKNYENSILNNKKAIEIDPNFANAYYNLALSYYYDEQYEKAALNFQKSSDLKPSLSLDSYNYIGLCNYYLKKYDEAIAYFKKSVEIDAKYKNAPANLGLTYLRGLKNFIEAQYWLKIAITIDPNYTYAKDMYNEVIDEYKKITISQKLKFKIELEVNNWQQKGEFESTGEYKARVSDKTRNELINSLQTKYLEELKQEYASMVKWSSELKLASYDADNGTFLVNSDAFGDIVVPVAKSDAPSFKSSFSSLKIKPDFYFAGDQDKFLLNKLSFTNEANGKTFVYDSQKGNAYANHKIDYNFTPIVLNTTGTTTKANQNQVSVQPNGKAEIDENIPVNPQINDKTFAIIIANEKYENVVPVGFASNDGKSLKNYCIKTLGIPEANVKMYEDATFGTMKKAIRLAHELISAFNGEAKVIFYYAGHGMPNESDKSAYLLPVDGAESDFESAIKLDDLYAKLMETQSKQITVILDACFSGSVRDDGMLAQARGVKIKPKQNVISGNMVVLSASSGDETAYPYKEKGHGMFTYFLLKKLQESKGNATLDEIAKYVQLNVKQKSLMINNKSQTPQLNYAIELGDKWKELKLK